MRCATSGNAWAIFIYLFFFATLVVANTVIFVSLVLGLRSVTSGLRAIHEHLV